MFSDRRLMRRMDRGDVQQHHHARSQLLNGIDDTKIAADTTLDVRRRNPIHAATTRQHGTGLVVYDHRTGTAPMTELCRVVSCIARLRDRREGDPRHRTDEGRDGHPQALRERMSSRGQRPRNGALGGEQLLDNVPDPPENEDDRACKTNSLTQTLIDHVALDGFTCLSASRLQSMFFESLLRGLAQPKPDGENACRWFATPQHTQKRMVACCESCWAMRTLLLG